MQKILFSSPVSIISEEFAKVRKAFQSLTYPPHSNINKNQCSFRAHAITSTHRNAVLHCTSKNEIQAGQDSLNFQKHWIEIEC